ncbi:hypothetical protein [Jiangella alkaliphila]|uniref:Uncharacterized protein n=1 Tax=Jiangella alkaliphila TaxID=419479 RepID=A0A1H2IE24_9ACTN|nr:hypothetical protein [Jiangella alkaliphila]SDU42372.1 hypothetical protein SAMN04488563_1644 [Jiangella alkaliphila]
MSTDEFDLGTVFHEVWAAAADPDPGVVAAALLARIPKRHYADALAQALRGYTRVQIGAQRRPGHGGPVSRKVSGIREQYAMGFPLSGGWETPDGWKRLRDCTRDDLLFAASRRRSMAAANVAVAERLEQLAALVPADGVVASIDPEVLDAAA